jgi:hypothetical protein
MYNVNVVQAGTVGFDSVLYANQNPANAIYIQNQLQNFSSSLNEVGAKFLSASRDIYNNLNSSVIADAARLAMRTAAGLFLNYIAPLTTMSGFQTAAPIMQRWVMANPNVRELYHNQLCNGYADTYVDYHPEDVGENHYDYRRVMDSVIVDNDEGSIVKYYLDDLIDGDKELNPHEKFDILSTWDIVEAFIAAGKEDPTSPYNDML